MKEQQKGILILSSDEGLLMTLERLLEDAGFETTTTWDPGEALRLLGSRRFDLVLLGDHPPDVDGGKVLRQLRAGKVDAPCIVLQSAARHPFEAGYFQSLGAYRVITKRDRGDLAETIRQCLRAWEEDRAKTGPWRRPASA